MAYQPDNRTCQNCKNEFVIESDDFNFYEKIKVPAPTWCPYCRTMRRLTWRNERTLYKRNCDMCSKSIIAMYPADTIFPVYCRECWFSDNWDATSYGRDFDPLRNFFEQVVELFNTVPQISMQVSHSVNSDFINQASKCKNCYMITSASNNEDCMYSNRILNSRNICDCQSVDALENSYQAKESRDSSRLINCDDCHNSFDCYFGFDVRNSNNIFMSSNIRSKSNMWYNQQLTKEEYTDRWKDVNLGSYKNYQTLLKEYENLKSTSLIRFSKQKNTINCTGNVISNSKNCQNSFYVGDIENGSNLLFVDNAKDIHDTNNTCCSAETLYEVNTSGVNCVNLFFSSDLWPEVSDAYYSLSCRDNANNLFGCVGIRKKSYIILNKEYSKEDYFLLKEQIIEQMKKNPYIDKNNNSYFFGEFFPPELSPFAFNESAAYTYTPLSRDLVEAKGWKWKESESKGYKPTILAVNLPDDIVDVDESILDEIIECDHNEKCEEQCTKAFRIAARELQFYKAYNLPLPRLCSNCRHYQRVEEIRNFQLYKRVCMCDKSEHEHVGKCQSEFETVYAKESPEIVYCEKCYQAEVY